MDIRRYQKCHTIRTLKHKPGTKFTLLDSERTSKSYLLNSSLCVQEQEVRHTPTFDDKASLAKIHRQQLVSILMLRFWCEFLIDTKIAQNF